MPFTSEFDNPHPADNPGAVIPVQRVRGSVFLACGTSDAAWPSCPFARAIISSLDVAHDRFRHLRYAYSRAGHSVGMFVPYDPANPAVFTEHHRQADRQASALDWRRVLAFLASFGGGLASFGGGA